jgi:hypothetical protein
MGLTKSLGIYIDTTVRVISLSRGWVWVCTEYNWHVALVETYSRNVADILLGIFTVNYLWLQMRL